MDLMYIIQLVTGFLGIFVLALTYTYIDKLEKTGCACSEHKYRKFIKNYPLFAIAFIALVMFVPPSSLVGLVGPVGFWVFAALKVVFGVATIAFYIMAIIYTRYLMKEKCKCSEDMRREVLFIYSIFELIVVAFSVLFVVFMSVMATGLGMASSALKEGSKHADTIMEASVNPLKSAKKLNKQIGKSLKNFRG
jgi:hypothetical protein